MNEEVITFLGAEQNALVGTLYSPHVPTAAPLTLFMHGGGQTRHSWSKAAANLAEQGLVAVTLDARGHGESDWVGSKGYSFPHYCGDLLLVATELRERFGHPPILVGASMGGISAMLAVEQAGSEIFSAIVLVDITPRMDPAGVDRVQGFMAEKMSEGFASVEEAAQAIASYLPHRPKRKSLSGLRKNLRQMDDGRFYWHWDPAFLSGPAPINSGQDTQVQRLFEGCRKITVPTLLVRGARSELVSEAAAQEFRELVPHSQYVDVADAGHMVAGDKNDSFAAAVTAFIRDEVLLKESAT